VPLKAPVRFAAMFEWSGVCAARPAVMGVVNVTPDSFSDGGQFLDASSAVAHGLELVAAGADMVDVGGESTRPGAQPVDEAEELRRVLPVVEGLVAQAGVPVSIDTTKSAVAAVALDAGASVVNDVSAGRHDPEILAVTADAGAGYIAMHMLGEPRTMQEDPRYDDVVREVGDFLVERLDIARSAGIAAAALAADPGIGFGKTVEHNLALLADLSDLCARVGAPMIVGTSRKRFLASIVRDATGHDDDLVPADRDDATLATVVWSVERGASVVRVHDVQSAARAIALLTAMRSAA
jgi:dihydropteroate synthase